MSATNADESRRAQCLAPLRIKCSGRRVIGGIELDGPTSGERLASLLFIIFTQLLTADTDVLGGSSGHRVPTWRGTSS